MKSIKIKEERRTALKTIAAGGAMLAFPGVVRAQEKIGGELYLETFGGAYSEAVTAYIVDSFREKHGVKVRVTNFGTGGEQFAKIKAGNNRIDVSSLNGSRIWASIQAQALLPLRLENIPNFRKLHSKFQNPAYEGGSAERYSAGLVWGDTAIAYNTDLVKEKPASWHDFLRPELQGRVSLLGQPLTMVQVGAIMTGQDINNIADLSAVEKKLEEVKPQLLKFWSSGSEMTQLLATREVWMANFWRGRVNKLREDGHPIQYVVPKEGAPGWVDCMVVPKTCENRRAAEAFIDHALDAGVQGKFVTEGITYAPCNVGVALSREQQEHLGATPEIFETAVFPDARYVAANQDMWNLLANRIKS